MPLRILHALFTVDPEQGGLSDDIRLLLAVGRHLKHRVEMLTCASETPWWRDMGITVHAAGDGAAKGGIGEFVRWLREHAGGYDCVLVSGVSGWQACRLWQVMRATGVPYFVFARGNPARLSGVARQIDEGRQRLCWPWAGYPFFRDAHAVFFASEEEKREASVGRWPYDCHEFVLASGVADAPAGARENAGAGFWARYPALAGKRLFSVVEAGRDEESEGLLTAVQMLINAGRWNPDEMRLLLPACPDGRLPGAVNRAVRSHGLGEVVHAIDTLPDAGRREVLQASEAIVLPAYANNSGRVVAEAFCMGKPVLIAKGPNQWREVVNRSTGLAEEGSIAGYQALLSRWLRESAEGRAVFGLNARRVFEAHYTDQAAANMLTAVIYLLIGAGESGQKTTDPDVFRHEVDFL